MFGLIIPKEQWVDGQVWSDNSDKYRGAPIAAPCREHKALTEISSNVRLKRTRVRPRLLEFGCKACQLNLCRMEGCFTEFHANLHSN
jgi:hypothetical protein